MVEETITLENMSVVEAQNRIEEIFYDVFGADDVTSMMFDGHPTVRSKSYGEYVEIYMEGGETRVDVSGAGGTIQSRIKSLGNSGTSTRSGSTGEGNANNRRNKEPKESYGGEAMGGDVDGVEVFEDGSIRFKPRFLKSEAEYRWPTDNNYDESHGNCRSCAHFIEGGGCHIVQGDIDKQGYCEEFYADVGVYGHEHTDFVEENLIVWGLDFDWDMEDTEEFTEDIAERIQGRIRGN